MASSRRRQQTKRLSASPRRATVENCVQSTEKPQWRRREKDRQREGESTPPIQPLPLTADHLRGRRPLNTSTAASIAIAVKNKESVSVMRLSTLRIKTGAAVNPRLGTASLSAVILSRKSLSATTSDRTQPSSKSARRAEEALAAGTWVQRRFAPGSLKSG